MGPNRAVVPNMARVEAYYVGEHSQLPRKTLKKDGRYNGLTEYEDE
jgi:hypothetical protein